MWGSFPGEEQKHWKNRQKMGGSSLFATVTGWWVDLNVIARKKTHNKMTEVKACRSHFKS